MEITRHRINIEVEKKMLVGLVISDRVCRELLPAIELKFFQTSYIARVMGWVKDYYLKYEVAPRKHLRDVFDGEKKKLDTAEANLIEKFLEELSDQHEEEEDWNEGYLIDQCMEYITERSLLVLSDQVQQLAKAGKLDRAKNLVVEYRKTAKATSSWIDPFEIKEVNIAMDMSKEIMFSFPGELGKLVGPFERSTLFAIMGAVKRGKTWMLLEIGILAVINRFKVVFISLEMRKEKIQRRLYRRISSVAKRGGGLLVYPCIDCLSNQDGSCEKDERQNAATLRNDDGEKPEFDPKLDYRICTYCRDEGLEDFVPDVWYVTIMRPSFTLEGTRKAVRSFARTFSHNFRLISYPKFSANLEDINRDLDLLSYVEGFEADVIIVDYPQILAHEKERNDTRAMTNETWMTLGQMSHIRRALVVAPTQSTRKSWELKTARVSHVAEEYQIAAHVDGMMILNQTPEEKKRGMMRVSIGVQRDEDFNEFRQVTVLQNLKTAQPLIDSEFIYEKEEK